MIVGAAICALVSHASAQERLPSEAKEQAPAPAPAPVQAYPLELFGLLAPPAERGRVVLSPSVAVSALYDDNLFLDNQNRQWDVIAGVSPAVTLYVNQPTYQLSGGYTFSAEWYQRESRLSSAFDSHNFLFSGAYEATPRLRFTLGDAFALSPETNRLTSQGFASGRQRSWSNSFTPGMTWQATPLTALSLSVSHTVLRFMGGGREFDTVDSDSYGLQSFLGYTLTPRLTGTAGYSFAYLQFHGQGVSTGEGVSSSRTHTPTLGATYRLTPTLTASVNGGVAITDLRGQSLMSPAGTASLTQTLKYGAASLQYNRSVSVAGGFGAATDNQYISGTLTLPTLQRGLIITFSPTYSIAESVSSRGTDRVDVRAFALSLGLTYQIARYASIFGGYTLLQQRPRGAQATQAEVDQNRVRFGLQFGYPISFD